MAIPASTERPAGAARDRGYHPMRVARVVRETTDATSIVFEVPDELSDTFAYHAGQFCTFRVQIGGQQLLRCYSMSSSPGVDRELQVTVKRVPGGPVSNWLNDAVAPGDTLELSAPSGRFGLDDGDRDGDIVAFAAGSGITPVYSILKAALAATPRRVRLLYANRDREAIIFDTPLAALVERHPDRLKIVHHLDVEAGYVDSDVLRPFVDPTTPSSYFICGPGPFMDVVERTLLEHGVSTGQIHIERFTAPEPADASPIPPDLTTTPSELTIELNGRIATGTHRPGTTILQAARELGMAPPFSCESGNCATCMAKLVVGEATMRTNNALTPEEVSDGWVLTCQAVPTTPLVRAVYE